MKTWIKLELTVVIFAAVVGLFESCSEIKAENNKAPQEKMSTPIKTSLSKEFKDYWYAGNAEITSYKLKQARYGEIREGRSVLVYVTEPFVADKQVKADKRNPSNIPVLKLNSTKKYLTGIYPYSIMSSSFYPVHDNSQAVKVTFSAQEWCGQVFTQINNREKFNVRSFSYFESEGDKIIEMDKNILENELWNKIRINPKKLPVGELDIIPSLEFLRMTHKELKAYKATVVLNESDGFSTYKISYPGLDRVLEINFTTDFPFSIESWSDSYKSGFGEKAQVITSTAAKLKTLKTPYWKQNGNEYLSLRDTLGL